jgi:hypothetical protein
MRWLRTRPMPSTSINDVERGEPEVRHQLMRAALMYDARLSRK